MKKIAVAALICAFVSSFGMAALAQSPGKDVSHLVSKVVKSVWVKDYQMVLNSGSPVDHRKKLPWPSIDKVVAGLWKLDQLGLVVVERGAMCNVAGESHDFWCRSGVMSAEDYRKIYGENHAHNLVHTTCKVTELKDGDVDCVYADIDRFLNVRFTYDNATRTWKEKFAPDSAERKASEYADSIVREVYRLDPHFKMGEDLRKQMYDKMLLLFLVK
jgi:hypothetical protein